LAKILIFVGREAPAFFARPLHMPPTGKILRATPSEATLVRTIGQMTYREHYAHLWHPPALPPRAQPAAPPMGTQAEPL
jgi:hypothetical protein